MGIKISLINDSSKGISFKWTLWHIKVIIILNLMLNEESSQLKSLLGEALKKEYLLFEFGLDWVFKTIKKDILQNKNKLKKKNLKLDLFSSSST